MSNCDLPLGRGARCAALVLAGLLGRIGSGAAQSRMETANDPTKARSAEVVVTAKKGMTDEEVTRVVRDALADDPYILVP